ncbi:hypothetical protein RV134_260009 [Roseovarius sp. EC-HK134]|nr:hypothetical protein RV134_260009 [Roseovarius sp. EC-HK134]VVT08504.1 hypothetical protein RV420_290234 [Roseovarius sp. EC-SD190]
MERHLTVLCSVKLSLRVMLYAYAFWRSNDGGGSVADDLKAQLAASVYLPNSNRCLECLLSVFRWQRRGAEHSVCVPVVLFQRSIA